jgi:KDO2-lipid IV(A) lauroyltransferase
MTPEIPGWSDAFAGPARRRALFAYWRAMSPADWRDLLAVAVLRRLPMDLSSAFGARSGAIRGPGVYRGADATARENLGRLRPDLEASRREAMLAERWRCVGRTMAEFSVSDRLLAKGRVVVRGADHLVSAAQAGRGVIIAALHLGNWEVFAAAHSHGVRIASFYQPRPTRAREHISRLSRRRLGYQMLEPGPAGVRAALRVLGEGQAVVIFADEEVDGVVRGPLFGRAAHSRSNLVYAARLARRSGAAVLPGFILRVGATRLVLNFGPKVELGAEGPLHQDVAAINAALEPIVLDHLDQWYHLHEKLAEPPEEFRL